MKIRYSIIIIWAATLIIGGTLVSSCKKFVEIDPPRTSLVKATVFENDATAKSAMLNVYFQLSSGGFASGNIQSITFLGSLSSDESINYFTSSATVTEEYRQFSDNRLLPTNSVNTNVWSQIYLAIYKVNAILEGLALSTAISENVRKQLEGEAKFIRAFCHFYVINIYGDSPLILSTDYRSNQIAPRTPKAEVYQQIVKDLKDAQILLLNDYSVSNNERVRANKGAATALLSRVYLNLGDWVNAEAQATTVINNALYSLPAPNSVFLKNSAEAIWQLSRDNGNSLDAGNFLASGSNGVPVYTSLQTTFVNTFDNSDQRRINWIGTRTTPTATYYYPFKYKTAASSPISEYSMVLRLAEQYLIRAEARAQQGKISGINGAESDVNVIRNRAALGSTPANNQAAMLAAIEQERHFELFSEWGHRWLDLKRTNRINAVLSPVKPGWQSYKALFPIPQIQITNDPTMANAQNPGY